MARIINESEFTQQVLETLEQNEPALRAVVPFPLAIAVANTDSAGGVGAVCVSTTWVNSIWTALRGVFSKGEATPEKELDAPGDASVIIPNDTSEAYKAINEARKELFEPAKQQRQLKKVIANTLCPAMTKLSDDVFEIAKVSTPILLSLSLAGTIALPIQPIFFAASAMLIARSGIATICKD